MGWVSFSEDIIERLTDTLDKAKKRGDDQTLPSLFLECEQLVQFLRENLEIATHPSFNSIEEIKKLKQEKEDLCECLEGFKRSNRGLSSELRSLERRLEIKKNMLGEKVNELFKTKQEMECLSDSYSKLQSEYEELKLYIGKIEIERDKLDAEVNRFRKSKANQELIRLSCEHSILQKEHEEIKLYVEQMHSLFDEKSTKKDNAAKKLAEKDKLIASDVSSVNKRPEMKSIDSSVTRLKNKWKRPDS